MIPEKKTRIPSNLRPGRLGPAACLLAMMLGGTLASRAGTPSGAGWDLAWNDEFTGTTLDTSKWRHWLPGKRRDAVNSPSAVSVAGGNLAISTYTLGGTHYTGMVATQNTYQFTYGYIEARIRFDSSPGMWSAFWMQSDTMGNPIGSPNTAGTEIDICEHRVVDGTGTNISGRVVGNIHWDGYGANHRSTGYTSPDLDLGSGYHVYGMEWTPTQQKFYIDGVLRWTINNGTNSPVSQRSEFIILSSEVDQTETTWAGPIPAGGYGSLTSTNTRMLVDYVRVYRRAETVINGDFEGKTAPFSRENQASWSSTGGRNASAAARLAPTSTAGAAVRQTVSGLLPDTGYTLNAWGNAGSTAPSLSIGANSFGGSQVSQSLTAPSYAEATVPFTTGPANRTASVFVKSNNSGSVAFADDFLLRRHATVNNGQVEAGTPDAWTSVYGGVTITTDPAYDGTYAWRFPAGANAGVEQEILGLSPNTTYRLTGWTTNGNTGLTFGVKDHGGPQVTQSLSSNTWTRATVQFTTGAATSSATVFAFRNGGSQPAFADTFFLCQPLAAPWTAQNIMSSGLNGTSGRLGNRITIQASGNNIAGNADNFHFVHQPVSGDVTITARILGVDTTAYYAKTGLMIRESAADGARNASVTWGPVNQLVDFSCRTATDGPTTNQPSPRDVTTAPWLRLTRRGNVFTAWRSPDGQAWTRLGTPQTIAMSTNALIGIPSCSGDSSRLAEALVDNVTIVPGGLPDVSITSPAAGVTISHNGQSLMLAATVTSTVSPVITWSKISGPGTVTFGDPAATGTSASFSAPGTYVLRCAATTPQGTGSADLTVNLSPAPAADSSLALRLKLDEANGPTAADSSGNNLHAATTGGLAWQPAGGVLTGAALFNGTDSYLSVPDHSLLDSTPAFTLSFWFRANTLGNNTGLVSKRVTFDNNNSYSTYLGLDGKLYVDINSNNNRFTSNTTFNTGTWHHVALVFDGSLASDQRAKLYVNGALDKTSAETSTSIPNTTAALHIGVLAAGGGNIFDGLIDEIRFHRRALSAAEVLAARNETGTYGPNVSTGPAPAALANTPAPLNGSATTEAGPAPTVQWTKVSGPGNVFFADPNSATTTVTFDQSGDYVLRLTATHPNGQTFAELADTVFPEVLPPPDLAITHPPAPVSLPDTNHRLRLTATADTHHVPGTPAFAWQVLSGPGSVTFANPSEADTTAVFSAPGTYLIRCTATNNAGTAAAQTSVTIGSTTASIGLREGAEYLHVGTFIRQDTTTWNSGGRDQLLAGKLTGGHPLRGILSFPLTWLPPTASLTHVSLDLWTHPVDTGTGTLQNLELRPLSATPVEGTGTASAYPPINGDGTGATWINRTQTDAWTTAGGDYTSTVLSSQSGFNPTVKSAHRPFPSAAALISAAQSALAAAKPLDLMLISPGTESLSNSNFARFASDDHPDPAFRPRLNVEWTTNPAPAITLGSPPAALNHHPASLSASVNHATTTLWTLLSGPGTATFANPALPTTEVTFDATGSYLLQLTATGSHGESSRNLTIDVSPNPAVFSDWQNLTWPGIDDPAITSPYADPDQDGRYNLLEWALHLDPNQPDGFQPEIGMIGESFDFTYIRRITAQGEVDFMVQWSDTLEDDWSAADVINHPPVAIDATRESVRSTLPAGLNGRRFVRVALAMH